MQGTCDKCWMMKDGKCPNLIETWWTPHGGKPELVVDCAPRRTVLMLQELVNRVDSLHTAQDVQRDVSLKVIYTLKETLIGLNTEKVDTYLEGQGRPSLGAPKTS